MSEASIIHSRPRGKRQRRRPMIRHAFEPVAVHAGGSARYAYPGMDTVEPENERRAWLTSSFAALLHLGLLGLLILLASLAPNLDENLIPVRILDETPEVEEPSPAPKALAERRMPNFSPQVQSVAPQVVNPRVIAEASPQVSAETLEMDRIEAVRAPTAIDHQSVSVERVRQVDSLATARASAIDIPSAVGPAVRGPVKISAPVGASVGPRQVQVATPVKTLGTSTLAIGSGSSVQEGLASSRDVLGSPVGRIVVDIDTEVGDGFLGAGGNGSGGTGGALTPGELPCTQRPEVVAYITTVRDRTLERWSLPPGLINSEVLLRFKIDAAGSASDVELVRAGDNALGASAIDAMRAASPFPPLPQRARCLSGRPILATFSNPTGES
ncbi:TonB family protein [Myxococcota bacterium]|nr:TonB family protein [Myxococcota bacterium]